MFTERSIHVYANELLNIYLTSMQHGSTTDRTCIETLSKKGAVEFHSCGNLRPVFEAGYDAVPAVLFSSSRPEGGNQMLSIRICDRLMPARHP